MRQRDIILLLLSVTAVAATGCNQRNVTTAQAKFLVGPPQRISLDPESETVEISDRDRTTDRANVVESILSSRVLQAALANPSLASNSLLKKPQAPVSWLKDNLAVEFVGNSEVLALTLRGSKQDAKELKDIVDAVCFAFMDEVVNSERLKHAKLTDSLKDSRQNTRERLEAKITELEQARESNAEAASIRLLEQEVEELSEILKDIAKLIERAKIESARPARIQMLETATISP